MTRILNIIKLIWALITFWIIHRPRLSQWKNKHQGQDCFIIGNGPSLNKMDLALLNEYHTIGLNKIYLIFKKINLHLDYIVAVNRLVIEQSEEVYKEIQTPIFISHTKSVGKLLGYKHIFKIFSQGSKRNWFFGRANRILFEGMTVTYVALQVAHYMGFKRVFLIGVDHNFVQKGNPHEAQTLETDDVNHFDPNYFKGQKWHLADLKGSEVSYQIADYEYGKTGRKIYDATIDGKLNIFEKIDFFEALRIAKKKSTVDG